MDSAKKELQGFEKYVEEVAVEAAVVAESAIAAPVEFGIGMLAEFSAFFTIIMIGVVWVLVWAATVYVSLWCALLCGLSHT